MGSLLSLFGGDNVVLTVLIALTVVLILIILGVWALKLVFNATGRAARGRAKRLGIVDISPLDQKRQLVLVRRDNVEHLLLIGGTQDLVIEAGITQEPLSTRLARLTPSSSHHPAAQQPAATPATPQPSAPSPSSMSGTARFRSTNLPPDLVTKRNPPPAQPHTSLRHTALMRPNERVEPDFIPSPPPRPAATTSDSDKKADTEPVTVETETGSPEPENRDEPRDDPQIERDGDDTHPEGSQKDN